MGRGRAWGVREIWKILEFHCELGYFTMEFQHCRIVEVRRESGWVQWHVATQTLGSARELEDESSRVTLVSRAYSCMLPAMLAGPTLPPT